MQVNGRVDIEGHNPFDRFILHDQIPTQQDNYYREALTGNWTDTVLSNTYFGENNINTLQDGIKKGVYEKSGGTIRIGNQDEDTLKIIMRSIFLQHSVNRPTDISGQVKALNSLVLNYCVPQVYGEAQGYLKYKNDVSTLVVPLCRPVSTYNSTTLELKPWF